jgi:hypothetical protein
MTLTSRSRPKKDAIMVNGDGVISYKSKDLSHFESSNSSKVRLKLSGCYFPGINALSFKKVRFRS